MKKPEDYEIADVKIEISNNRFHNLKEIVEDKTEKGLEKLKQADFVEQLTSLVFDKDPKIVMALYTNMRA